LVAASVKPAGAVAGSGEAFGNDSTSRVLAVVGVVAFHWSGFRSAVKAKPVSLIARHTLAKAEDRPIAIQYNPFDNDTGDASGATCLPAAATNDTVTEATRFRG
jgi:hypothetical protein